MFGQAFFLHHSSNMHPAISHHYTTVDDLNIHYLEAGEGEAIVFLHGWPTSAYLWRNILPGLAKKYRVIAIDLPGFGQSDKHPEDSYSFRYYNRVLTGFLANLQIDQLTLGLHDLGGPIGLSWLVQNMDRVDRLILFNTLVYPPFSWAVKLFTLSTMLPGVKSWLSAPNGIRRAMRFGVYQKDRLTDEAI
ncbi:MAG: alpha/beta fold hydrolase, partial [Bacteroidota bacterium]